MELDTSYQKILFFIIFSGFLYYLLFVAKSIPGSSWKGHSLDEENIDYKGRVIILFLFSGSCLLFLAGFNQIGFVLGILGIAWVFKAIL